MKYIYYLIISTLIYIVQSTLCNYIAIADIKPNLMLIFAVIMAFFMGSTDGLVIGIMVGLLHDCFFGHTIGSNLFLYGIIGYISGCLTEQFNKENIAVPMLLVLLATLLYNLGFYLLNIVLKGYTSFSPYIILNILPEVIYNLILGFAIYLLVYYFQNFWLFYHRR